MKLNSINPNLQVVVTGSAGFIGARLVKTLIDQGHSPKKIIAVDHDMDFESRNCCSDFVNSGIHIVDKDDFLEHLKKNDLRFDVIFHMGASSSTTETREDFLQKVNVDYSKAIWDYCCSHSIPLYYASSAATYGEGELGYSDDPKLIPQLKPLNLYGMSKQKFDLYVLEQQSAKRTPPHWAGYKFFNVYGPGEDHKGKQASVVWHARNQFLADGFVKLFKSHKTGIADGEQKRDFVYVDDVVDAMLFFASQPSAKPGIYNLGTGIARSFKDLVTATAKAMKVPLKIQFVDTPVEIRDKYQYWTQATLERLRASGYERPFTSLEDGVSAYIQEISSHTK